MEQWVEKVIAAGVAAVFASIGWLVRTVLTNNKKIEMLEKEISNRDKQREEDRKVVSEIKQDMKDLRQDLHNFLFSKDK